jgi:hypothetical protein
LQFVRFPFFAGIDPLHIGFWQFLGPLVFAFAPLILLAVWNSPSWRAAITIWVLGALGIGASSGMTRYLLPVLPIALAAVVAGVSALACTGWRITRVVSMASIAGFAAFGLGGLLVYDSPLLSVAVGLTSPGEYLRVRVQAYEQVEFLNQTLAGNKEGGNTLVFLRHLYYLRIPFLYGDPEASWAVDPARLQSPQEMLALLHAHNVRWVMRAPEYPASIAAPLHELEAQGRLIPIAQTKILDLQGMRISGYRELTSIVIFRVTE